MSQVYNKTKTNQTIKNFEANSINLLISFEFGFDYFDKKMVFCYIVCINSKTFLVVSPRFWVVRALERLPTWKFDLRDLEEVEKVNLPRLAASRRP